jgi:hypothetical protein
MTAGYSGTPLAKKLGVKMGQRSWRLAMPEAIASEIAAFGEVPLMLAAPQHGIDMAHVFVTDAVELSRELAALRPLIAASGMLWISWPKRASKYGPTSPRTSSDHLHCRWVTST